jgi:diguanylate cyclase (GGDEF)-like protein
LRSGIIVANKYPKDPVVEPIGTFGASRYTIRNLQLFSESDEPAVAAALAACEVVRVPKGGRVLDPFRARLYVVLSGAFALESDVPVGTHDGTVTMIHPGESFGEQSVLDEAPNLSRITATEEGELLVIEPDVVWRLIDTSSVLPRNLLRLLSFRVRAANALLRRRQKLGEFYRQLSLNDPLTGLYNRAWLNEMLAKLVGRARQDGRALSLVMIDLDHFKKFNDTHGHLAGDSALCAAANVIRNGLRPTDFAVRYGGEEMMVVLPETTSNTAVTVADRLCKRIRQTVVFDDMRLPLPHITGSFGVASLKPGLDEDQLVEAADAALYRAKEAGRDTFSL